MEDTYQSNLDEHASAPVAPLKTETFRIENEEDVDLTIRLEPWGQELALGAGVAVELIFQGAKGLSQNLSLSRRTGALVISITAEGVAYFRMVSQPKHVAEMREAS